MVDFNQAMLAPERYLSIRIGSYDANHIKEATFNFGYIAGDNFFIGSTCAGTAQVKFSDVITSFRKLQTLYSEIAVKVDDTFQWIKMGTWYINDIKIDRNAHTTTLELMDGMFKLNQPYITDLVYPAQIRDVVLEIATKTGVTLESDDLGLVAIQNHIEKPFEKKGITFREVLGQCIQLLGFSAFFNRDGKLEIRYLTESGLTITADDYYMHGLDKSEIEYTIAGITCKKNDKEVLRVGDKTGRSLEIENNKMNDYLLNELYNRLRPLRYYPYSLRWRGHLNLQVGQWITLVTNKNETLKVPVLRQSFTFSGGLSSVIGADSKAKNDTQYSYSGFLTRKIVQQLTDIESEIKQQLEYAEQQFNQKQKELEDDVKDSIEKSQAQAEVYKQAIQDRLTSIVNEAKNYTDGIMDSFRETMNIDYTRLTELLSATEGTLETNKELIRKEIIDTKKELTTVITSLNNDVFKKSEFSIQDGRIQLSTGAIIDGNHISSMLIAQPQAVTAITDKFIIAAQGVNIVRSDLKNTCFIFHTNTPITSKLKYKNQKTYTIKGNCQGFNNSGGYVQFYLKAYYTDSSTGNVGWTSTVTQPGEFSVDITFPTEKTIKDFEVFVYISPALRSATMGFCDLVIIEPGKTELIVDGTISGDKLLTNSIETGHLKAGSVTADILAARAVTADKMLVDTAMINKFTAHEALINNLVAKQAFINKVKTIDLDATRITGGILKATNNAVSFNLNSARLDFNQAATINFNSNNNAVIRKVGDVTGFLHFGNASHGGTYVGLGVTSHNQGVQSMNTGKFAGIRIFRSNDVIDQTEVYGDRITFSNAFNTSAHQLCIDTLKFRRSYDMSAIINSIVGLWRCWEHLNNAGWKTNDSNFANAVYRELNTYKID